VITLYKMSELIDTSESPKVETIFVVDLGSSLALSAFSMIS